MQNTTTAQNLEARLREVLNFSREFSGKTELTIYFKKPATDTITESELIHQELLQDFLQNHSS